MFMDLIGKYEHGEKITLTDCALAGMSFIPCIGNTATKGTKSAFALKYASQTAKKTKTAKTVAKLIEIQGSKEAA